MSKPTRPLTHAPKNPTRRSKEERERLDKLESQRRQARADASAADAAAESARRRAIYGIHREPAGAESRQDGTYRGGLGGSSRYIRGGRGGFMGQRGPNQRPQPAEKKRASAPSAKPAASEETAGMNSSAPRRTTRRSGPVAQSSRAAESEPARPEIKQDPDGDLTMHGVQKRAKDDQDYGYISSDDEEKLGKNIEYINLVSDEEGEEEFVQPLRLLRKPHRDRGAQIPTDTIANARGRRERAEKSRTIEDLSSHDALLAEARKGKARSNDTNIQRSGADAGSAEDDAMAVKEESRVVSQSIAAGEVLRNDDDQSIDLPATAGTNTDHIETKDAAEAKTRPRRRTLQGPDKRGAFQTAEERRENNKWRQDLEDVQNELGYLAVPDTEEGEPATAANLTGEEGVASTGDAKENTVYLFQLPPIIPDLLEPAVKQEVESPEIHSRPAATASATSNNPATSGPIKIEDGKDDSNPQTSNHNAPRLDPGKVGKFRVHESGRATLTWGGITMEVSQGINPHFLQSVVLANFKDFSAETAERSTDIDVSSASRRGGEATCFGQVRGKLVVTPDWSDLLG